MARHRKKDAGGFALMTFIAGGLLGAGLAYMGRAEIDRIMQSFGSKQARILYAGKYVYYR